MTRVRLALVQSTCLSSDKQTNFKQIHTATNHLNGEGVALLVLPELFATPYVIDGTLAEPMDGMTVDFMRTLAGELDCMVLGGVFLRDGQQCFNSALCVTAAGDVLARYDKQHLFLQGGEGSVFTAGRGEVPVIDLNGFLLAPFICFDLRFADAYRVVAPKVDAAVTIAAWPDVRARHFNTLIAARAVENGFYSVGVNRSGQEETLGFAGGSMVVGPDGAVVAKAGGGPAVLLVELDKGRVHDWRQGNRALLPWSRS